MKPVKKPKDLQKLKRAEERERRTREAVRMAFNAAGIGDQYAESLDVATLIEAKLVPTIRALKPEAGVR